MAAKLHCGVAYSYHHLVAHGQIATSQLLIYDIGRSIVETIVMKTLSTVSLCHVIKPASTVPNNRGAIDLSNVTFLSPLQPAHTYPQSRA